MWFYANLAFCLLGTSWFMLATFRKKQLISLQVVAWGSTLLFLFVRPIFFPVEYMEDFKFNLIMFFGIAGLFIISFLLPVGTVGNTGLSSQRRVLSIVVRIGTLVFVLYNIANIIVAIRSSGSVLGALTINRKKIHLEETYFDSESVVSRLIVLPEVLFYIHIFNLWKDKKRWWASILYLTYPLRWLFIANTRFPITQAILAFIMFIASDRWRRTGKGNKVILVTDNIRFKIPRQPVVVRGMMLIILLVSVAVVYNYLGEFVRSGLIGRVVVTGEVTDATLSSLKYYTFLHDLYQAIETRHLDFDYGKAWVYYNPITLIPRRWWPSKPPLVSTSPRLTSLLVGPLGTGIPVYTYTIYGEGYWQFGYIGAFLAPILFLLLHYWVIHLASKLQGTQIYAFRIVFGMIPYLRAELPFPTLFLEFVGVSVFLYLMSVPVQDVKTC